MTPIHDINVQEVPQQDLGDQDLNPVAAAEWQSGFGEDEVYSKDAEPDREGIQSNRAGEQQSLSRRNK